MLALFLLLPVLLILLAIGVLAGLIRWGLRLGIAAAAALILAALLPPAAGQGWIPWAVFVAVLVLLGASSGRRNPPSVPRTIDASARATPFAAMASPGPAWPQLRRIADWRSRRRLDAAWDACRRYLLLAQAHEHESAQLPIKIARHVPAIVETCVRHSRVTSGAEQRALVADTLTTLEALADRAETRRRELAHDALGAFRTLQAHLSTPED